MESRGSDGGEEEEGEEDEEEAEAAADAWLVQSLRLYRDLHSFELQAPTRVIEWAPGNRVCVAGYGHSGGNEILQLLPPPTLQVKETQDLCPERDFKVECGGFSDRPIYSLKSIPDTSLLVTSGPPDSSLQVWQVSAEDSDVIKAVSAIPAENSTGQPWAKIAAISGRAPWVLHGSRLNSIQITEVESRKNVYTGASTDNKELSGVAFLDCNTFLLCCAQGQLCLADVRQPRVPLEASSIPSAPSDVRKTSEALAWVRCRVPSAPSSAPEFLCISWAPALENCLGVSGFDGTVHVYQQRQSWGSSGREAEPIFVHKGHVFGAGDPALVTVHTWHPQKPRTLLSAAGDGSLQVWDWVESCGERGQI